MTTRTKNSAPWSVKETILELVRVGRYAYGTRDTALQVIAPNLKLASRRAKAVMYDEEQLPLPLEMAALDREAGAWLAIAAKMRQWAEYAEAKAERASIREKQTELGLDQWQHSTPSLRRSAGRSNVMLCAAPIGV